MVLIASFNAFPALNTSPTSFLYSAYDVIINKLSKGAVGFSVAAAMTIVDKLVVDKIALINSFLVIVFSLFY
jgi:hypothetical protein